MNFWDMKAVWGLFPDLNSCFCRIYAQLVEGCNLVEERVSLDEEVCILAIM